VTVAGHNLASVAFPTLDDGQIATLARCAKAAVSRHREGETLFAVGDRDFKFFVVRSGAIEIIDPSDDSPKTIRVHGPGEFTGDVAHLTGSPSLVNAVARGECEVYEISAEALRELLNRCPDLSDVILQAFIARRDLLRQSGTFTGIRVIGSRYSRDTFRVRDFLAKNRVLFTWLDLETHPDVKTLLRRFGLTEADTPVVAYGRNVLLRNPTNRELAEVLGIRRPLEKTLYDLAIVGAGPAGLAAAVYGASEGLRTVVLERTAPGGQAGRSMRIENYLGFPTGITGAELADRAVIQATKFGAHLSSAVPVVGLAFEEGYPVLRLDGGDTVATRCLLIASGAEYRRLPAEGCEQFEGCGVYYAATMNELPICRGQDVVIVGGGNSAGQAAVFLAPHVRRLYLVIRGDDLYTSMSSYLAGRIEQTENIQILYDSEVVRMQGDGHLAAVEIVNKKTGERRMISTPALFSFIGAVPRTEWLLDQVETDSHGFVRTGVALNRRASQDGRRDPFLLETNRPGVFAAGDVRSGSVKRVASAVGEGAMAVQFVHEYLKGM
jgi:thioredoxin reductase (NADPH)